MAEGASRRFTAAPFTSCLDQAARGENAYYGETDAWLRQALQAYPVAGHEVLVFGSVQPWYEAMALTHGAASVAVLDYQPCLVDHPQVHWLGYPELERQPRTWQAALSISSFEHDGLGRYGDPLDPDGDLKAMARAATLLAPGGLLYLSVPVGRDTVMWNAHRIYGRVRLPRLLAPFSFVAAFGFDAARQDVVHPSVYQPVFVLRREAQS
ncbi:DUF268 domain-containing protein [Solidesulfovibrio alcoholivorans]|uniref:DUF268 domain-containing protein n=1 Tax=Solidesulfovibrio alcoholivorans TaxID=81406 RepID=UPI000694AD60|nr:DUF268 domain-containing protein [Solidesulfovibrio alcoholivorans]